MKLIIISEDEELEKPKVTIKEDALLKYIKTKGSASQILDSLDTAKNEIERLRDGLLRTIK